MAFGPVLCEKSIVLPALLMNAALPPVLVPEKAIVPGFAADPLVIVADPPVLELLNWIDPWFVMLTVGELPAGGRIRKE